jgi:small GTP-binding protein
MVEVPMPHRTFMQVAKRRLVGKEGSERVRMIKGLLEELPDYRSGPYADIRKWLNEEIERTRVRAKVVHRDHIAVRREGAAQIALVGPPNAGKSSLLQALSEIQIKTGDYAFTTTRPIPALTRLGGVLVQLVEIPGLIRGAADDRAGGRALLGVLRGADAIAYCCAAAAAPEELAVVRAEVVAAGIDKPSLIAATRFDEATAADVARLAGAFPMLELVPVSVLDDAALDAFREALLRLTGLIRVYLRHDGKLDQEPVALRPGDTVVDVADRIHHELGAAFRGARVWGPSARFAGQRVGRGHLVEDGDAVEILRR